MNERPTLDPINAVVAEAPSAVGPAPQVAASLHLLGGDEIIQLSLRPSPWSIALNSFKLVVAMALLAAAVAVTTQGRTSLAASLALAVIVLVAFSTIVAATLQWASQLYVLTNRRVLRFHGVFSVNVAQCALAQIGEARVHATGYESLLRIGTIHLVPASSEKPVLVWSHVARPAEVHEILARAIQKSKVG